MVVEAAILVDDEHHRKIGGGTGRSGIIALVCAARRDLPFELLGPDAGIVGRDDRFGGAAGDAGQSKARRGGATGDAGELGHEGAAVHAFVGEAVVERDHGVAYVGHWLIPCLSPPKRR